MFFSAKLWFLFKCKCQKFARKNVKSSGWILREFKKKKKSFISFFTLYLYFFSYSFIDIIFFLVFFFCFFYPWLLVHDTILRKFTMKFWFHSRYFYLGLVKKKMSSHAKPLQHVYKAILRVMYGLRKFMLRFHTWCNFFHAFSFLSLSLQVCKYGWIKRLNEQKIWHLAPRHLSSSHTNNLLFILIRFVFCCGLFFSLFFI